MVEACGLRVASDLLCGVAMSAQAGRFTRWRRGRQLTGIRIGDSWPKRYRLPVRLRVRVRFPWTAAMGTRCGRSAAIMWMAAFPAPSPRSGRAEIHPSVVLGAIQTHPAEKMIYCGGPGPVAYRQL